VIVAGEPTPNEAERRRWNDPYWTRVWPAREALTGVVTEVLLDHLHLRGGDRVLDVGSGGGTNALAASRRVGTQGIVVGADISERLVQLARQRAEAQGATNVRFVVADVQVDRVDAAPFTAALSQFGVMFFDQPRVAFSNILDHLEGGGRLAFACWQDVGRNPWHIGHAVGHLVTPQQPAPGRAPPGPFSLSDPDRTGELLRAAGWEDVQRAAYEVTVSVARDALVDDGQPAFMGVPDGRLAEARSALEEHLTQFDQGGGRYRLPLAYQIFTAAKPEG
jgi:SAM-dependent methyltransferase